jgi:hypothetical protein
MGTPDERQVTRILTRSWMRILAAHPATNISCSDCFALAVPDVGDNAALEADRADSGRESLPSKRAVGRARSYQEETVFFTR